MFHEGRQERMDTSYLLIAYIFLQLETSAFSF